MPILATVKVDRDYHFEVGRALYSAPGAYLGERLEVRAVRELVKAYHHGVLVVTHPAQAPGVVPPAGRTCPRSGPSTRCGT